MKIIKIEAIPIEIPFKKQHDLAVGIFTKNDHVIVKVYTDEDIVGIGEVSNIHVISEETQGSAVYAIRNIWFFRKKIEMVALTSKSSLITVR